MGRILNSGVQVLFISGDGDPLVSYESQARAFRAISWKDHGEFDAIPFENMEGGDGLEKEFRNMKWVRLYGAGHCGNVDQPETDMFLLDKFLGKCLP